MTDNATASAGDILFNKFAVQAAKRKALVQSWMIGAIEKHSKSNESDSRAEEEDAETLYLKPDLELAGLGVDLRKLTESERLRLDPDLRSEDASTAFLRERLLGKAAKPVKSAVASRPTFKLAGVAPGFTPARKAASTNTNEFDDGRSGLAQAPKTRIEEDDEDEDEIGRSGIGGKRLSARPKAAKTNVTKSSALVEQDKIMHESKEPISNGMRGAESSSDVADDELDSKMSANIPQPEQEAANKKNSRRKVVSYLDELLAQKSAKKQKRGKN